MRTEEGLNKDESFAVAANLGVEKTDNPTDKDEVHEREAIIALVAPLTKIDGPKAEEPSPVTSHLMNDFKMNSKVTFSRVILQFSRITHALVSRLCLALIYPHERLVQEAVFLSHKPLVRTKYLRSHIP